MRHDPRYMFTQNNKLIQKHKKFNSVSYSVQRPISTPPVASRATGRDG